MTFWGLGFLKKMKKGYIQKKKRKDSCNRLIGVGFLFKIYATIYNIQLTL